MMKLLKPLVAVVLMGILSLANAEDLASFDGHILTVPVVNTVEQVGKYERVQFKVAKDGRWDLVSFTEPKQATVKSIRINKLESLPVQVNVEVMGYFPNGCYGLGGTYVVRKNSQFNIVINMTELQTFAVCTQALVPFEITVPLDVKGLNTGVYKVSVNGTMDSFELN